MNKYLQPKYFMECESGLLGLRNILEPIADIIKFTITSGKHLNPKLFFNSSQFISHIYIPIS